MIKFGALKVGKGCILKVTAHVPRGISDDLGSCTCVYIYISAPVDPEDLMNFRIPDVNWSDYKPWKSMDMIPNAVTVCQYLLLCTMSRFVKIPKKKNDPVTTLEGGSRSDSLHEPIMSWRSATQTFLRSAMGDLPP